MKDVVMSVKSDKDAKDAANRFIDLYVDNGQKPCELTFSVPKGKYSGKQRKALHVWCTMLAETLNECGRYQVMLSAVNGKEIEYPWDKDSVKKYIYKPILKALSDIESTEDQSSVDPSKVALVISKHFGETGMICPSWPSLRG